MNRIVSRFRSLAVCAATGTRPAHLLLLFATLFAMAGLTRPKVSAQDLDVTRRRVPARAEIVWDNVTDSAQVVRGPGPKQSLPLRVHTVHLDPGMCFEFLVPAHEMVRVATCNGEKLDGEQLQVWTSDGSGLYRRQRVAMAADRHSMIAAPDQSGLSIAKIVRPSNASCGLTVALFTSRRATPKLLDYYQCPIVDCGKRVEITDDRASKPRHYSFFAEGASHRVRLEGPTRLRLEARLKYGPDVQQRQTFWIQVYVDGRLDRVLSFDTLPQRMNRVFVDGAERTVGRREFAYLDLDCGESAIELRSSHSIYLRVDGVGLDLCRSRLNRSFPNPSWQNTQRAISNWDAQPLDPTSSALGRALIGEQVDGLDPEIMTMMWDPYGNQQMIQGLARDNRTRHSGLRAYMWMRAIASLHYGDAEYGDEIDIVDLADRIRERYTFFRNMMPMKIEEESRPRMVAFHKRQIRSPKQKLTETIVAEQHVPDAVSWLPRTTLHRLPIGPEANLTYQIPQSLGATILRLVVDQTRLRSSARLLVQFDDRPPIELKVEPTDAMVPIGYVPSRPEAGLSALASSHEPYDSGTGGGPYAMSQPPVPIVCAATAELLKPANVNRVRVSVLDCGDKSVNIGMQCMDARRVQLAETSFRQLSAVAHDGRSDDSAIRFAQQELDNNAFAVERLLKSHEQAFSSSVEPSEQLNEPTDVWDDQVLDSLDNAAKRMAEQNQWPEVIESLTEIIGHSNGDRRNRAILDRAEALVLAGEEFLANREMRGWVKYGTDPKLQYAALERLLEMDIDDHLLREQYLAYAGIHLQSPEFETLLARQLTENGRHHSTLLMMPSLVANDETRDIILRCSIQSQWWRLFDETVRAIPDAEQRNLWSGLKQLRLGRFAHARRLLGVAGDEGARWLGHWKRGDHVFKELTSANPAVRLTAIGKWENWQANHPGPRIWKDQPDAVKSYARGLTIYSQVQNTNTAYFMAKPTSPATVEIHGPVKIKIQARPLHPNAQAGALNDWLLLSGGGVTQRVPISNNCPSKTLTIEDAEEYVPGSFVTAEIDLPAGLNRFQIAAAETPVGIRVLAERPEIASPVLPHVNETTMAMVIKGVFGRREHQCNIKSCTDCIDCVRLICRDSHCRSIPLSYLAVPCRCNELDDAAHCFNQLKYGDALPWQDRVFAVGSIPSVVGHDPVWAEASEATQLAEANALIDPNRKLEGLIRLHKLIQLHPRRVDLRRMWSRLRSGTGWEIYREFDGRAGIHAVPIAGWQPENPQLRVRRSLCVSDAQYVLTGSKQLSLQVGDVLGTEFQIAMRRPRIGFLPMGKTIAVLDSPTQSQAVELGNPNESSVVTTKLEPGTNGISISHGNPLANHFIHIDLQEAGSHTLPAPDGKPTVSNETQRIYQVATKQEPLKFRVKAPALLRIDRYDDEAITHQVVPVEEDRDFALEPEPGRELSMIRIFQLSFNEPTPVHRPEVYQPETVESWTGPVIQSLYEQAEAESGDRLELMTLLAPDVDPLPIVLQDGDDLGLQNMGTWSGELGFHSRNAFEESPNSPAFDQFLEGRLSRYFYDQWTDRYLQNELLVRPRFDSGVTLGMIHQGMTMLPLADCSSNACAEGWGPVGLQWKGHYFHQFNADKVLPSVSRNPFIFGASGSISRSHRLTPRISHQPNVTLFGRVPSEDVRGYQPGAIDIDVFTPYKSQHRYGLRFSDRWIYQNCLDKRWWVRPALMSNEDEWVPDNLGCQFGTDQLLGPLQLKLSYRVTGYLADDDRKRSSVQNVLYLDLMLERWHNQTRRSEFRFTMRNDLDTGRSSIGVNVVSFLNHARGYRDFRPNSILFRSIREERAARHYLFR